MNDEQKPINKSPYAKEELNIEILNMRYTAERLKLENKKVLEDIESRKAKIIELESLLKEKEAELASL
jgi:hypothetical protein